MLNAIQVGPEHPVMPEAIKLGGFVYNIELHLP